MKLLIRFILFTVVDIYLFLNLGKIYGLIGLAIILFRLLYILGFLRSITIYRGAFNEGMAYLKDYQGSYRNSEPYKEAAYLIKSFKDLGKFVIIGIFYDKPGEVPEDKLRSSIGVYCKNVGFPDAISKELESYFQTNNYYSVEFPTTSCLCSSWDYSNSFVMMLGIMKFYKVLKQSLEDVMFKKTFKIREEPKTVIELYPSENKIQFWVPTFNQDKFFVYKKEDKTKSE